MRFGNNKKEVFEMKTSMKWLSVLLALCLLIAGVTAIAVAAEGLVTAEAEKDGIRAVLKISDKDYEKTDYTCDLGNVVIVTYSNGTDSVSFILNYNIYDVEVRLESGEVITLGKYEYREI